MGSKIVSSFLLFLALLNPFAVSHAADGQPRGTLYRVSHEGHTAYLFGTIHVGQPSFYPLEPRVTEALSKASKLAIELDVRNADAFRTAVQKYGFYDTNTSLPERLSPAVYAQLRKTLGQFGIPPQQIVHMKPWMVANLLVGLDLERQGYARSQGLEFHLLDIARNQAKPVVELESAEYQLSLFDTMNSQEQESYLRETLEGLADGSVFKKLRELVSAWSTADAAAYDTLLKEAAAEKTLTAQFTQQVLLDKRNGEMTQKIEALLKNEPSSFVGVGLLHLLGDGSVPALLRQRGYAVEKLY